MGFSGGGSSALKPHTHDSTVVQDGGSLNFDNITQAGLTSGDINYSDGIHLQRLAIGGAGESLVVNGAGTFPEWASASSGAWASEGNDVATSRQDSLSVDVSDADVYQILYNVADVDGGTCSLTMRINNDTSATAYASLLGTMAHSGTMAGETSNYAKWLLTSAGSESSFSGVCYVYKADLNFSASQEAGVTFVSESVRNNSTDPQYDHVSMGQNSGITGAITNIKMLCMKENTSANEGIIGSMRVNSLSFS